jgi:hypothetical protein
MSFNAVRQDIFMEYKSGEVQIPGNGEKSMAIARNILI